MNTINENSIINHIKSLYGKDTIIEPIGNHDMNRNRVYKVSQNKQTFVIKYYFKKDKRMNEVKAIDLLKMSDIACPQLLHSEVTQDGVEFSVFQFVEGMPLLQIHDQLSEEKLKSIYFNMGITLAKIHNIKTFNHYNTWNVEDKNASWTMSYKKTVEYELDYFFEKFNVDDHEAYDLIKNGYTTLKSSLDVFDCVANAVLCHHDFSARNIMVNLIKDEFEMTHVFDFEHSKPSAAIVDLIDSGLIIEQHLPHMKEPFYAGYRSVNQFNQDQFKVLEPLVSIYMAIIICSWSKDSARDFYDFGIKLLKKNL